MDALSSHPPQISAKRLVTEIRWNQIYREKACDSVTTSSENTREVLVIIESGTSSEFEGSQNKLATVRFDTLVGTIQYSSER